MYYLSTRYGIQFHFFERVFSPRLSLRVMCNKIFAINTYSAGQTLETRRLIIWTGRLHVDWSNAPVNKTFDWYGTTITLLHNYALIDLRRQNPKRQINIILKSDSFIMLLINVFTKINLILIKQASLLSKASLKSERAVIEN